MHQNCCACQGSIKANGSRTSTQRLNAPRRLATAAVWHARRQQNDLSTRARSGKEARHRRLAENGGSQFLPLQ